MSDVRNDPRREREVQHAAAAQAAQDPRRDPNGPATLVEGGGGPEGPELLAYNPYDANTWFSVGFPGMKSTSMEDQVDTYAANANIGFGVVVTSTGAGLLTVQAGGTGAIKGISVHDHIVATFGGYRQFDAVSVMTRGRLWCATDNGGTIQDGAAVNYLTASGLVTATAVAAGIVAVPHATFRGPSRGYYNWMTGTTTNIAEVELHYPMAA